MTLENWRDVPGFEGFYQVSDLGNVRSLDREIFVKSPWGVVASRKFRGRVLKCCISGNGYRTVKLTRPGQVAHRYVHFLVCEAFLGRCPKGLEVCHGDGDRTNNALSNLRYDTRSENAKDAIKHGKIPLKGEACGTAKLTEDAVRWIRQNKGEYSHREMGARFNVSHNRVGEVLRGKSWAHVQ